MQDFGPLPDTDLMVSVRKLELEVRRLKRRLLRALIGNKINLTNATGSIPPSQGGTGSPSGPMNTLPRFINDSGGALAEGAVVVLDSAGAREIKTTTTVGNRLIAGVVHGTEAPYAAAAETPVLMLGWHAAVLVNGAVAIGDYLRTSTSAGRAVSTGTDPLAGVFAIAGSAFAGPGNGTVSALVLPGSMTRLLEEIAAAGDLLIGAAAGDLDKLGVGANPDGYVLTLDSAEVLKMKWAANPNGGRFYISLGTGPAVTP